MELAWTPLRARVAVPVALALVLALGVVGPPAPAAAAPGTAAEAEKMVEQAARKLTVLDEQVHEAKLLVAEKATEARKAKQAAAAAEAALAAFEPRLRAIAQTGYTGRQSRVATFLVSDSADELVQQMATLDVIADRTDTVVSLAAAAREKAQETQQVAAAAGAKAAAALAELKEQRAQVQARQDQYEASFARLSAAAQARVNTSLAGPTLDAPDPDQFSSQISDEAMAAVIKKALEQVGDTYVWGGVGPDGFDCSGLTMFAYAAAGISLPHSSRAQAAMGRPVSRGELQPGDLIFFYSPISHVGLYIGDGKMVHARTFGQPVNVTGVDMSGYVGARRIV